mmetsp:Transcript_44399/g.80426  ORF Transcript_44399/g.80426 Transcript_44399/m.80426 type:complete len:205 (-) Transcript_44399:64-678(-)
MACAPYCLRCLRACLRCTALLPPSEPRGLAVGSSPRPREQSEPCAAHPEWPLWHSHLAMRAARTCPLPQLLPLPASPLWRSHLAMKAARACPLPWARCSCGCRGSCFARRRRRGSLGWSWAGPKGSWRRTWASRAPSAAWTAAPQVLVREVGSHILSRDSQGVVWIPEAAASPEAAVEPSSFQPETRGLLRHDEPPSCKVPNPY